MHNIDKKFLKRAIEKARESVARGGFPAGSIIVINSAEIVSGVSLGALLNDPTSHSETVVVREACGILKTTDLSGAILYASMQPCLMCFGASVWAKIPKIVFACSKEKVSEEYYGGHYDMSVINAGLSSPVDLVHISELEQASLEVVREWEASQTRSVS